MTASESGRCDLEIVVADLLPRGSELNPELRVPRCLVFVKGNDSEDLADIGDKREGIFPLSTVDRPQGTNHQLRERNRGQQCVNRQVL